MEQLIYLKFFRSFYDSAAKMPPKERLAFYDAIMDFAFCGEIPQLTGTPDVVFTAIKPVIEQSIMDVTNGKKGGRPKKETGVLENEKGGFENSETYKGKEGNRKEGNRIEEDRKEEKKEDHKVADAPCVFKKPTIKDIREYCTERRNNVDAEAFYAFYESNGWKVGKNPMKNWKQAVITWEKREDNGNHKRNSTTFEERNFVCHDWSAERPTL